MSPQIALLFCIVFIIALFMIDSQRNAAVSSALWVPLIWLLFVGSRSIPQWLSTGDVLIIEGDNMSGNSVDQIVVAMFLFAGLFILSKRKILRLQILKGNGWIFFWFLFCGFSVLWSDYPAVSLRKWVKGVVTLVMVLTVVTEHDPFEAVKTLVKRCAFVLIPLSFILINYYPHIGIGWTEWGGEAIKGVALGKNQLGRLCMVCGFFFFWDIVNIWHDRGIKSCRKEIFVDILLFVMTLRLLLKSQSATSIGAFGVCVCIFAGLGSSIVKRNVSNIGSIIIIACVALFISDVLFGVSELFVKHLGRNMTFTERTSLWSDLLNMGTNPYVGTGYDSFWLGERQAVIMEKQGWLPNEAHNGYLEVYLDHGLVGLLIIAGVLISTYRKIRQRMMFNFEYGRGQMALLIMFLLFNFTESAVKGVFLMWVVFLLISVDFSRQFQSNESAVNPL
jgi:exopolysaccharide production protein ExoQ